MFSEIAFLGMRVERNSSVEGNSTLYNIFENVNPKKIVFCNHKYPSWINVSNFVVIL